ncbi:hypothetical protein VPH35_082198 [Triticum aestivum]
MRLHEHNYPLPLPHARVGAPPPPPPSSRSLRSKDRLGRTGSRPAFCGAQCELSARGRRWLDEEELGHGAPLLVWRTREGGGDRPKTGAEAGGALHTSLTGGALYTSLTGGALYTSLTGGAAGELLPVHRCGDADPRRQPVLGRG